MKNNVENLRKNIFFDKIRDLLEWKYGMQLVMKT